MTALHHVLRPIPGPEGTIDCGQTVDVSDWRPRNVKQLVERRYLRPVVAQTVPSARPSKAAGKE